MDERSAGTTSGPREAYARGWWVRETLADSLADAAHRTPQRVVLIDGDYRLDCHSLHEQATALAQALLERMARRPIAMRSSSACANAVACSCRL